MGTKDDLEWAIKQKKWKIADVKILLQQLEAGDTISIFNARKAKTVEVDQTEEELIDEIHDYLFKKLTKYESELEKLSPSEAAKLPAVIESEAPVKPTLPTEIPAILKDVEVHEEYGEAI